MKDILRQFSVIFTVILTITINALANILPINGLNTGQISDSFKVFFVPAGYVFSIWGIIYIGLISIAIYQALPANREAASQRASGWWISLGGLANSAWIFLWHYQQFVLSVLVMLLLLATLIITYINLGINSAKVTSAERWAVHLPISVYLGWITVATVANITVMLEYLNWGRFGLEPLTWMGIILGAVVIIASLVNVTRRDSAYTAVILWALVGIAVKFSENSFVLWASVISIALVFGSLLISKAMPNLFKKGVSNAKS
jgi:hypothetical protein